MKLEDFVARANQLIALADAVLASKYHSHGSFYVDKTRFSEYRSASLSFLKNVFGSDHPYYNDFETRVRSNLSPSDTSTGKGILQAVRDE